MKRIIAGAVAVLIAILTVGPTSPVFAEEAVPTFTSTWDTTLTSTGSSGSNQIKLPLVSNGTYDFVVDWGDGSTPETISSWNTAATTHTYASPGIKTITITGTINGFSFANTGDRLKITDVSSWGQLTLGNNGEYFSGAENLDITATDSPNLQGTTNMSNAFRNAISLTDGVSQWNVSNVTNMRSMFEGATTFNDDVSLWNVSKVTSMLSMFKGAAAFNVDLSAWNVRTVTTMRSMFEGAEAFDQDISSWDISNVVDMARMFAGGESVGMRIENYDALLQAWAALPVQPGVDFGAGNSYYNPTTSLTARNTLVNDYLWTITDAGAAAVPSTPARPTAVAGSQSATVTWVAPNANNSAISSYTVTSNPHGKTCQVDAPALSCVVLDLTNDVSYTFSVVATNAVGSSLASPSSAAVTPRTAEPAAPAKPFAEALDQSARIWVSPGTGGGAPATYDVTASPGAGSCRVTVPANSCTISGLDNSTEYTFTATATNEFGTSLVSVASNAITPAVPFAMKWDTTKTTSGSSGSNAIRLPLVSDGTYNFTVSWGDGTGGVVTSWNDSDAYHVYSSPGEKNITITGTIRGWSFGAAVCNIWGSDQTTDRNKLLDISSWGPLRLDSPNEKDYYFCWAQNLNISATDTPNLASTTSLKGAFYGAGKVNSANLNSWNVSNVTNMSEMFYGASTFNQPLASWNTTNVTDMSGMFRRASAFNQPLNSWNTSNVTLMNSMFNEATKFNQSLNSWDTADVTTFASMFDGASLFNGDISSWNTSAATNMSSMFQNAAEFNQDISLWKTGNVTNMNTMFNAARKFNVGIGSWNTAKVTTMRYMLANTNTFNQDLGTWDTSLVTDMSGMFQTAIAMNSPLDGWGSKTSEVRNMGNMFYGATAFNQTLDSWNVGKVTSMSQMFYGATSFNQPLNSWRPSNVTDMTNMFYGATSFNGNISAWTVGKVVNFTGFMENASAFNQDIGGWSTSSVTTMDRMFRNATVFNQDLRSWDMGGVTTAANMFAGASLSTANYNKMLYSWAYGQATDGVENGASTGVVTDNVVFSAGTTKYSLGQPAAARAVLVARGWSITDGGSTAQNVPNPPTAVTQAVNGTTATISWTPPVTANPVVTSYRVRAFVTSGSGQPLTPTNLGCTVQGETATTCDVTGLTEGTSYLFDVVAINAIGASDPSQMQAPAIPAAPIAQSRFESAKVGWIAQPTFGGDPVSYTITALGTSNSCVITLPEDTCLITGLSNSQSYTFTATATNELGTSNASAPSAAVTPGNAFVTTWRTQNTGSTGTTQIRLPLVSGGNYNFTVSWGDGTSDTINAHNAAAITHTYPARGDYDVTITGTIEGWQFANGGDRLKLVDVNQWGPLKLGNLGSYFQGASNMQVSATDALDLTGTTNLSWAFDGAAKFNGAIGNWDVSGVTTMQGMFRNAGSFNQPLNAWNIANVTDTSRMFSGASSFNQPLNNWNVSNVTNFYQMFNGASAFNSSVSGWVPSKVTTMQQMFVNASAFNQPIDWTQTGAVTTMLGMFQNATNFNQSLTALNTSNVTDMSLMFANARNFNGDISTWNTSKVTTMSQMFYNATSFNNSSGINSWNTSNVTSMHQMFRFATVFNRPIGSWNTGKVTDLSYMFQYAPAFNQPVNSWDTSKVTSMLRMFEGASAFNQSLNDWNTGSVTGSGMSWMFYAATAFNGSIGNWNVSKITDFSGFLYGASAFNQDVSKWNTSSVTNFSDMFRGTRFRGDVSSWTVTSATTMSGMFSSITPDSSQSGLLATPWLNKILIAWAKQPVRTGVVLNFSDTTAGGFPKYTVGTYSLGSEAAYSTLTRSTGAWPTPGKGWSISTGGTTTANTPGTPLNVAVDRSGAEDNGAEAIITWTAPTTGDTVSAITYRAQATTDPTVGCTVAAPATTCEIRGMTVNKFFQFTVTASNAVGSSDPSDPLLPRQFIGPLIPVLGTPVPTPDGYTVPITNYNGQYIWSGTATAGGVVTINDATGVATISGVAPDTASVATITASRFAYTDQSTSVTGTSLKAALVPDVGVATRTADGFTAPIANYDAVNYTWTLSGVSAPAAATVVSNSGTNVLTVTGLTPDTQASIVLTTTRAGYAPGTTTVTAASLKAALTPDFVAKTPTADGFTATITNYDASYDWGFSATRGTAAITTTGGVTTMRITGVSPETSSTVTVTTLRSDSVSGSASISETSLKAARTPIFRTPVATATGFTVVIDNYDGDWTWTGEATAEGVVNIAGNLVTVSGLGPGVASTVTITSSRDGYAQGTKTATETSLMLALVPTLAEPTRTVDGFTAVITNYDANYTWSATRTTSSGTATISLIEGQRVLVVSGLAPADPATVRVTTQRAGYATGEQELTSSSLNSKRDPIFGQVLRTADGYTAEITNYDGNFTWTPSVPSGSAVVTAVGATRILVVSGLAPDTLVTATVAVTRTGYVSGSGTVTGRSLLAALNPDITNVVRTPDGFTATITNYDAAFTWAASVNDGDPTTNDDAEVTTAGAADGEATLIVSGLKPATRVTATVTTTRTDYASGSTPVTDDSLKAPLTPTFGNVTQTADGFTVAIDNYDTNYGWQVSASAGTVTRTNVNGVEVITVSSLAANTPSTVTVATTRTEHANGTAQVTGTSLKVALTPTFGTITRTSGGFTAVISNYDANYSWSASSDSGTASVVSQGSAFVLQVTGLAPNTTASATVTTTRSGHVSGSANTSGTSLNQALTPAFGAITRTPNGFTTPITNYDAVNYTWSTQIDDGDDQTNETATFSTANGVTSLVVAGINPATTVTVTVANSRSEYANGLATVQGTSLLAAHTPTFETPVRTADGFTAKITNYDASFTWNATVNDQNINTNDRASITTDGTDHFLTVTGLVADFEATATVTTSQTDYADGSATVTGRSLKAALTPTTDAPVATADGFTAKITNYDGAFTWSAAVDDGDLNTNDSAAITTDGTNHFVTVTGLQPGVTVTAVINTSLSGHVPGTKDVTATSLLTAHTPTFGTMTRAVDGFTAEISNYDATYTWSATSSAGSASIDTSGTTPVVKVTGLASGGTRATATVRAVRADSVTGSASVSGRSTLAPLTPTFGTPVRAVHGFSVEITNYDSDYTWTPTASVGTSSLTAIDDQGTTRYFVSVTGLADGQTSKITVATEAEGPVTASADVTSSALSAMRNPIFGATTPSDGGFSIAITNYDANFTWSASATRGTASIDASETPAIVRVTGLGIGEDSTVTVTTTQPGYRSGSSDVTATSLRAALTPQFDTPVRGDRKFTATILNYDASYTWTPTTSKGAVTIAVNEGVGTLIVNALNDGEQANVTVTTTKSGHFQGSGSLSAKALDAKLTPSLGTPVPTDGGFTVEVSNYDENFTWTPTTSAGTINLDTSVTPKQLRIAGLSVGQTANVNLQTTRSGYLSGTAQVTGRALQQALTPIFGDVVRTADGFTTEITNYDNNFIWSTSTTEGSVQILSGSTPVLLQVTGLTSGGQRATVTLGTEQTGFFNGSATVSGRSILGALTPTFAETTRTVHGFTAKITNYDADYTWRTSTTQGSSAIVESVISGQTTYTLTVTGLADGQSADVTVETTAPGNVTASAVVQSAALGARLIPTFGTPVPTTGGFTVEITNYDADFTWTPVTSAGSATIDASGSTKLLRVTGLGTGQELTVTVGTTRDGYRSGTADVTGTSTRAARTPNFGPLSRNDGGISAPIINYDASFTWQASATPGTASIRVSGGAATLEVTGLADGQATTATVTTSKAGHFGGSAEIIGNARETELVPVLGTPVSVNRGFTVEITNYDPAYTWTPSSTRGQATVDASSTPAVVRVTGLDPVQSATLTVTTSREGYLNGSSSVVGEAAVGGRLDPAFAPITQTTDGFTAVITNHDAAFTWSATSDRGQAAIVLQGSAYVLRITGVGPNTTVNATVTTTRTNYDNGSTSIQGTSLRTGLTPEVENASRLKGAYSVDVANYNSKFTWTVTSTIGSASINDQGLVRVSGLEPGQTATLQIRTTRTGFAPVTASFAAQPLAAAYIPKFDNVISTVDGFTTKITNYDSAFTWRATVPQGQVTISGDGTLTVTGLAPSIGTEATVTTNQVGREAGTATVTGNAMIVIPPAVAPVAPAITEVATTQSGRASITWTPQNVGGAPVIKAELTCRAGGITRTDEGTGTTLTVTKLKIDTKYSCSVKVANIFGWSPASEKEVVRIKPKPKPNKPKKPNNRRN